MSAALVVLGALLAGFPAEDPRLAGGALGRPDVRPNDPRFAPWARGGGCEGQTALYGFSPPCARRLDPDAPLGAAVDRAWLLTLGDPRITIAVVSEGVDLSDPRIAPLVRLSPGELRETPDRDGDGVLTVLDFTSATGTAAPTRDRVVDPRLLARPDRGDVDGDGLLGPRDVARALANGRDDDDNGLVDDIAGWDFLDGDADPTPAAGDRRGTRAALAAAERGDDGRGGIGACPRCTILPLRVGARGLARAAAVGTALHYAVERSSRVVAVAAAIPGAPPFLERALERAARRGSSVVVEAGPALAPSVIEEAPLPGALLVDAVGFSGPLAEADSGATPLPCRRGSLALDAVISGARCARATPAGHVAGILGLLADAGLRGARDRPPPRSPPSPAALTSALLETTRRPARPARDPRRGAGLIDARRALEHILEGRAAARPRWRAPRPGEALDPTGGTIRAVVEVGVPASTWTWSIALGPGVAPERLEVVAEGVSRGPRIEASIDVSGRVRDPAAAPRTLEGGAFTLRVSVETLDDGRARRARADRVVFLRTDLDLLPGFPVDLGAPAWGGPRLVDGDGDGRPEIWLGLLDGRLIAVDGRGAVARAVPARTEAPSARLLPGLRPPVPFLAAPTAGWSGSRWEVAAVAADAVLTRLRGSATSTLGASAPPSAAAPAGRAAPAVAVREGDGVDFAWPGRGGVLRAGPAGLERWLRLERVPSALALELGEPPVAWVRAENALVATDGRRVGLEPTTRARGLGALRETAPYIGTTAGLGRGVVVRSGAGALFVGDAAPARLDLPEGGAFSPALSSDDAHPVGWRLDPEGPSLGPSRLTAAESPLAGDLALDPTGAEIAILDVDGGAPELVFGGDTARLFAVSENGRLAAGWPKLTGRPVMGTPAAGDLDGDGRVEIAAATRDGRLFAWRTRGRGDRVVWGGERRDASGSANTTRAPSDGVEPGGGGCRGARPLRPAGVFVGLAAWGLRRRGARAARRTAGPSRGAGRRPPARG